MIQTETRPRWYMAAAIASVLFMLVGVAGFVMDLATDPRSLPADQQALEIARPLWMKLVYALAVWTGLAGSLLVVFRRRLAEPLLMISLVTTVLTFVPYAVVPAVRQAIGRSDVIAAVIVMGLVTLIYAFARRARRRGWLQ